MLSQTIGKYGQLQYPQPQYYSAGAGAAYPNPPPGFGGLNAGIPESFFKGQSGYSYGYGGSKGYSQYGQQPQPYVGSYSAPVSPPGAWSPASAATPPPMDIGVPGLQPGTSERASK